ncbi:MAG: acetyltransferase [Rhodospirillales bacterium]|jgi:GNAT superfamily N-acetyltransferase|nr:acetyltransferase [Rhodospirillales bacterium]
MAPIVRRAVPADSGALTRLRLDFVSASHPDRPIPDDFVDATRRFFGTHLAGSSPIAFWVAEEQGRIIAHAALILFQKLPNLQNPGGLEGYVSNVLTLAAHRRRGIAAGLLDAVKADARERGIGRLWLFTSEDGEPLYARAGFERAANDAPMMELMLSGC